MQTVVLVLLVWFMVSALVSLSLAGLAVLARRRADGWPQPVTGARLRVLDGVRTDDGAHLRSAARMTARR